MDEKLPIYKAMICSGDQGWNIVSLVEYPAVESDFVWFSKEEDVEVRLQVADEEKRMITGVVLRADYPILRVANSGYRYYITFDRETIELGTAKWLAEGTHNMIDLQHDHNAFTDGLFLMEAFIKDSEKGINPKGFEGIADGSLFATYKVMDDTIWESIKAGEFKGFSIEGIFSFEEAESEEDAIMSEIEELINKIKNIK